jgi:amino acid adenylation domain-containing protein
VSRGADRERLIHEAVAGHAVTQPESTAIIAHGDHISYQSLDRAACAYAAELADRGVGPGQVIPLLRPRSAQLIALQLGVLKCGAAYANVDPRWPAERRKAILGQIRPVVVVADTAPEGSDGFPVYSPDEDVWSAAARNRACAPMALDSSTVATVFFTSGTTGTPKGVMSPHQAVTRLFRPGGLDGFGPGHVTPQAAALPWDMYAFEVWGQLTSGGTVALVDGDHLLPNTLRDLVRIHGVDTLWLTVSLFNLFVDEDLDCFRGLGRAFIGGEKLSPGHVRRFLERHPDVSLRNAYGPAESGMFTTNHPLRPQDCDVPGGIPVGTTVAETTVLVLNDVDQPCAPGEPGEICVAGRGLAVKYLGDPELTAAKFPTITVQGDQVRIYRTGDIGMTDNAGVLHFRGRRDRQVKVSGHRVELGDIEATVLRLTGIRDCVALAVPAADGQVSHLALFYLSDVPPGLAPEGTDFDNGDHLAVRDQLLHTLPGYLVPAIVRGLPRFPLTANGKRDNAALLELAARPVRRRRHVQSPGRADRRVQLPAGALGTDGLAPT